MLSSSSAGADVYNIAKRYGEVARVEVAVIGRAA